MSFSKLFSVALLCASLSVLLFTACRKENRLPLLTTSAPFITDDLMIAGGAVVYAEGDAEILEKGLCWSETSKTPDINSSHKIAGKGANSYTLALIAAKPQTTYYVCAYAINEFGTSYGNVETLYSGNAAQPAIVNSTNPSTIGTTSLVAVAYVESELSQVKEKGFCWSDSGVPDITGPHLTVTSASANFTAVISGLSANTSYSIRPYARTAVGISYGSVIPVKTYYGTMTDQSGNVYKTIKVGDQVWMAENFRSTMFRDGQFIAIFNDDNSWYYNTGSARSYLNGQTPLSPAGWYYNFNAVSDARFAPQGWHVPTQLEWLTLINTLGGSQSAGEFLKTAAAGYWSDGFSTYKPSGFDARPAGYRTNYGSYQSTDVSTYFVSLSYLSLSQVFALELNQTSNATLQLWDGRSGFSVRLVKD